VPWRGSAQPICTSIVFNQDQLIDLNSIKRKLASID
jgi:hypothetical protein